MDILILLGLMYVVVAAVLVGLVWGDRHPTTGWVVVQPPAWQEYGPAIIWPAFLVFAFIYRKTHR